MSDVSTIANMLIGKVEEYGALFNNKVFPLFVQRQIMWGYINIAEAIICLIFIAVATFLIRRGFRAVAKKTKDAYGDRYDNSERETYWGVGFSLLALSSFTFVGAAINAVIKLATPEYAAILALLYLVKSGK